MPQFQYKAYTTEGVPAEGSLFAGSAADAVEMLSKRGWTPTRLAPVKFGLTLFRRVTLSEQIDWYSMLADLLASGMPIGESLELLIERSSNPALAEATRDLRSRVLQGEPLSQAMKYHPKIFDSLAQHLIAAGEEGNFQGMVLEKIAMIKESRSKLGSRLTSAFSYPLFLLLVGVLVFAGMMFFFVPKFEPLFERMRESQGLPWATEFLFRINHFLTQYWFALLIGITATLIAALSWLTNPNNGESRDRFLMKNSLVGPLLGGIACSRFCQILGSLLASGVRIQQATLIAGQASGNRSLEAASEGAVEKITSGLGLADSLESQSIFPREIIELIRMGERTNRLEKVLQTMATRLEVRNEQRLDIALRLLEPFLMVTMAVLIGFVMIALLMPIFNASGQTFQ